MCEGRECSNHCGRIECECVRGGSVVIIVGGSSVSV